MKNVKIFFFSCLSNFFPCVVFISVCKLYDFLVTVATEGPSLAALVRSLISHEKTRVQIWSRFIPNSVYELTQKKKILYVNHSF